MLEKNLFLLKKRLIFPVCILSLIILLFFSFRGQVSYSFIDNKSRDNRFSQEQVIIDYHEIKIDFVSLAEIFVVEELYIANTQNTTLSSCDVLLKQSYVNLEIEDSKGPLLYEMISEDSSTNLITIHFRNLLEINQTVRISLNYLLDIDLPKITEDHTYYNFMFQRAVIYTTLQYHITIRLPKNSFIHEDAAIPYSYYPDNAFVDHSGERIFLVWEFENLQPLSDNLIFVLFDEPIRETPHIWIPIVSPIVGLVCGAFGVFWWMRRRENKSARKLGDIFLNDDQKLLLKLIIEADGSVTQKDFIQLTGHTKSKISRNLIPLEEQGLIKKTKWGREYKVSITKTGRKVIE